MVRRHDPLRCSDCQSCLTHCAHVLSCCEQTYLAAYNGILFFTW